MCHIKRQKELKHNVPERAQILDLVVHKDVKRSIINMFKELKEIMTYDNNVSPNFFKNI